MGRVVEEDKEESCGQTLWPHCALHLPTSQQREDPFSLSLCIAWIMEVYRNALLSRVAAAEGRAVATA